MSSTAYDDQFTAASPADPTEGLEHGTLRYDPEWEERQANITFVSGDPAVEMLKIGPKGFWVRGIKVPQDDKEAETVYNAFKSWMIWSEMNRR